MVLKSIYFNPSIKTVRVTLKTDIPPIGYTNIGDFEHTPESDSLSMIVNHVLYHHIRDELYYESVYTSQHLTILDDTSNIVENDDYISFNLNPATVVGGVGYSSAGGSINRQPTTEATLESILFDASEITLVFSADIEDDFEDRTIIIDNIKYIQDSIAVDAGKTTAKYLSTVNPFTVGKPVNVIIGSKLV